jgi:hypothetical protein
MIKLKAGYVFMTAQVGGSKVHISRDTPGYGYSALCARNAKNRYAYTSPSKMAHRADDDTHVCARCARNSAAVERE